MTQHNLHFAAVVILMGLGVPSFAQVLKGSRTLEDIPERSNFRWTLNPDLVPRLTRSVSVGPRISVPIVQGPNPGRIASAGRRLVATKFESSVAPATVPAGRPLLSSTPTTLLPASSPGMVGPENIESAMGTGAVPANHGTAAQTVQVKPGGSGSTMGRIATTPRSLPCIHPGVSDVNGVTGTTAEVIFLEPGKHYAIHGCGFANQLGEAYLTGVTRQNTPAARYSTPQILGRQLHPGWIPLLPSLGADPHQSQAWTDTEIQIVVDPNASGFYDSYFSATIVVIPSGSKQQLQSARGFGFFAARVEQTLSSIPLPASSGSLNSKQTNPIVIQPSPTASKASTWYTLANVGDTHGNFVKANLLTPSGASLVLPGHTFAVVRDDSTDSFPGRQDTFDFAPSALNLTDGFQPSQIQLYTASLSPGLCPSGSNFSTNGGWSPAPGAQYQFTIYWQEQSCGTNGISAYAVDVTVIGPRGVTPF
jgi:hypothetical protein